ncbi:hypothetical protein [Zavarzinia aquatilis]|uniref:Uncharacterized protein n=1 Tax=Zavarzinia aquatilis TaxID=2211142 RepID=A0A317ECI6_9PROT|nr:hypothetical protein [Zavarzinia aquatilis]PWR24342.1 hypothetical protein DKG74_09535 [Zavarzinia aquatilis]
MLGLLVKAFAILLALGLAYVSIKRALLPKGKKAAEVPPQAPKKAPVIEADDMVRCPACGTYNAAGQPCAVPDCPTNRT